MSVVPRLTASRSSSTATMQPRPPRRLRTPLVPRETPRRSSASCGSWLPLYRGLGFILGAIGIFLFIGAMSIGGAAVRESTLEPGQAPDPAHVRRARFAMAGVGLFVALMLFGGWAWWNSTDAEFQARLYRPFTTIVSVNEVNEADQLRLTITDSAWLERHDANYLQQRQSTQWSPLIPDHGKI